MAYDPNDPRRLEHPTPPEVVRSDPTGWIIGVAAVLAIVGLIYAMMPSSNDTQAPRMTENAPRTEAPAKPTPTPPAVTPQAEPSQKPATPPATPPATQQ
jgi:hypothetical protein